MAAGQRQERFLRGFRLLDNHPAIFFTAAFACQDQFCTARDRIAGIDREVREHKGQKTGIGK
jgi:hypothetical protein